MKKLSILTLAAAGMLMASCSQEDLVGPAAGGDGNFNITVKLPSDLSTRALGDGYTANKLQYAVYVVNDDNSLTYSFADEADFGYSLQTTLSLNLITGKQYQLAFFAQSTQSVDDGVYTFSPSNLEGATPKITVAYDKMTSASNAADAYDCFFKLTDTYTVGQEANPYEVVLTRPVAQINWGTSELGENNEIDVTFGDEGQYIQTTMQVSGTVYSQFNILDQDVEPSSVTSLTLGSPEPFGVPEETPFPVDPTTYDYVAVQYVLVPSTGTTYDLTLNIYNGANGGPKDQNIGVSVPNAPVQANYRTNIYGNLLSTNATFLVEKQDFFAGVNNMPVAWDGTSKTTPKVDDQSQTVTVSSPSDLAGLADMVTNGTYPEGYTTVLASDLDMNGKPFPGIGDATYKISEYEPMGVIEGTKFTGVFDGKGYTISNLTVKSGNNTTAAFIKVLDGGTLQNVNFENVNITGNAGSNDYANQTGIVGIIENGGSVTGVTVDGVVNGVQYTSGIVGAIITSGSVSGCTNNATVNGSKYIGGIVGGAMYCTAGHSMSISDCHNTGNVTSTNISATNDSKYAGGIVGMMSGDVSSCTNSGNVSNVYNSTGGIAGELRNTGSIKNSVNTGTILQTGTSGDIGAAGGIVGFVRYWNYNFNPEQDPLVVSGNTNYADVSGNIYVGGIVGNWYYSGTCENNSNYASTITATQQLAGGILGTQQWIGDKPSFQPLGKLIITGNKTSTTIENIVCPSNKNLVCWINSPSDVEESNNQTGVEQQLPPTE
ncbi:MAG: hypothetical protein J1F07_08065 [Muribaculaceae bacterium]|nr:hypothetical protein [Muribaculaceae bacterium]